MVFFNAENKAMMTSNRLSVNFYLKEFLTSSKFVVEI